MSARSDLNGDLMVEQQLMDSYLALRRLSEICDVPAVRAATRVAAAELRAALDSQAAAFTFFSADRVAGGLADGPAKENAGAA